jgi:hypothetical protein
VCPSSFIDRRRVRRIPQALHKSKAPKHGHCRVRTSSIGADRGDDGIRIYGLAGSFITVTINKIAASTIYVRKASVTAVYLAAGQIASGYSSPSSTYTPIAATGAIYRSTSVRCDRLRFRQDQVGKLGGHVRQQIDASPLHVNNGLKPCAQDSSIGGRAAIDTRIGSIHGCAEALGLPRAGPD